MFCAPNVTVVFTARYLHAAKDIKPAALCVRPLGIREVLLIQLRPLKVALTAARLPWNHDNFRKCSYGPAVPTCKDSIHLQNLLAGVMAVQRTEQLWTPRRSKSGRSGKLTISYANKSQSFIIQSNFMNSCDTV
jgi:hypothetical protein